MQLSLKLVISFLIGSKPNDIERSYSKTGLNHLSASSKLIPFRLA